MSAVNATRSCLHLVAGAGESALRDCLGQRLEGDEVLFIDAGVMHLLADAALAGPGYFFSGPDLDARGLASMARRQGVQRIDDRAAARMLHRHPHCLTWK